jgi:hypothetical protein
MRAGPHGAGLGMGRMVRIERTAAPEIFSSEPMAALREQAML